MPGPLQLPCEQRDKGGHDVEDVQVDPAVLDHTESREESLQPGECRPVDLLLVEIRGLREEGGIGREGPFRPLEAALPADYHAEEADHRISEG